MALRKSQETGREEAMRKGGRIPSYRLHKPSGKAVVTLSGRDTWFPE
jgi:hypothetical protein